MPEPYWPKHRTAIWTLSKAAEGDQLVWVECGYCRGRQHYEPRDLIRLFGDVDVNQITRRMTCQRCGRKDNMQADVCRPAALERVTMTIRRLVEIKVRRVPVWRDEKPRQATRGEQVSKVFNIDLYADGACIYRLDKEGNATEIAAWARNNLVAQATFKDLCERYPEDSFEVRRRGQVLGERPVIRETRIK